MTANGGELLVRTLARAGIDTIFTLHGGHLDAIFQAALDHGLTLVDTRHEQAAGHAADGWARTTGQTGVAIVTAGPGFTDCITAIANAHLDCIPTLFIAGAAPLRDAETLPLQGGLDQVAMVAPITKWAHQITHTHRIPDLVAHALRMARSGRPGPVFLEVPIDVLFAPVDDTAITIPAPVLAAPPRPTADAVVTALDWLQDAARPVILAGGGTWFSGAERALVAFAERTGIPVFTNGRARGTIPAGHPLCGGGFTDLAMAAMTGGGAPDVVLLLGARIGLFTGGRSGAVIPHSAKVIQVDIEPSEIGRNRDIELGITADCRQTLLDLDAAAAERAWPDRSGWQTDAAGFGRAHALLFGSALEASDGPIHPYRLMAEIARALPEGSIVTADGGETASWMDMVAEVSAGGRWMSHGYLGCLGTGMPFAIAAQVAHPHRRVLCVVGDGSVGLNFAEFDTMVRHRLPIVVVVNNDQQWGMSAHGQDLIYGHDRRVVTDLSPAHYEQAAAGFGCHAEHVTEIAEIGPALERAFASGLPACVNVLTDPSVIAPVTMALCGALAGDDANSNGGKVTIPYYEDLDT